MKIYVKTFAGNTIVVEVESEATVAELKEKIQHKTGISLEQFRLISGKELEEEKLVSFYELEENTTLHMVLRVHKNRNESACLPKMVMFSPVTSLTREMLLQKLDNIVSDYIFYNKTSLDSAEADIERANRIKVYIANYDGDAADERTRMANAVISALQRDFKTQGKNGHMNALSLNSYLLSFCNKLISNEDITELCIGKEKVAHDLGLLYRTEFINNKEYTDVIEVQLPNTNQNCLVM